MAVPNPGGTPQAGIASITAPVVPAAISNGLPSPSIPPPVSNGDAAHAAGPALQMIADPVNVSAHTAAVGTAQAGKGPKAAGSKRKKVGFEERPGKAARVTDDGNPGRQLSGAAQPGSSSGSLPNDSNAAGQPTAVHAPSAAGEALPAAEPANGLSDGTAEAMQTDAAAAALSDQADQATEVRADAKPVWP